MKINRIITATLVAIAITSASFAGFSDPIERPLSEMKTAHRWIGKYMAYVMQSDGDPIVFDHDQLADIGAKLYPDNEEAQAWFIDYAIAVIQDISAEAQTIIAMNLDNEAAMVKEIKKMIAEKLALPATPVAATR